MSCMDISIKALAGVRETLKSSLYWREQTDEKPLVLGWVLRECRLNEKAIDKFVEDAFFFNATEYFKGEQAKNNAEPKEWGDFIFCLKNYDSKRLPLAQFFKTLEMIDYNTEPKGWLTKDEYENWSRKSDYEKFKEILHKILFYVASSLVSRLKEYEDAEWYL